MSDSSQRDYLRDGILKRIHVDQHTIKRNARTGTSEPPISVKVSRGSLRCHAVEIVGPSTVIYSPDKPLACGARVWVETRAQLTLM
jgi:hypothetical protein